MHTNEMGYPNNISLVLCIAALMLPGAAWAHASEQSLVLLLPTTFYTTTGTLSVVLTMLLVAFLPAGLMRQAFRPVQVTTPGRPSSDRLKVIGSTLSFLVLLGLIVIGLAGPTDPQSNLLPLTIWTVWWIALFIVQALVFDIWAYLNPWYGPSRILKLGDEAIIRLPSALGVWPAVVSFLAFQAFLLADVAPHDPRRLAQAITVYFAFNLVGMTLFGRKTWLDRVEGLTGLFRLLSLLRPFRSGKAGLPGWSALQGPDLSFSQAVFCLVVLASGSFDGLYETFWWLAQIGINPLEFPGRTAVVWSTLLGLLGSVVALIFVYLVAVWIGRALVLRTVPSTEVSLSQCFRAFAVTLLPIALGYHAAHYLVSFLVQIRVTLSTAADPFAQGWDLLGLSAVKVTTGFLNVPDSVKTIWLTQASVVVASHVLAVLMAHQVAERLCASRKSAIALELGISILMVAYTVFGLWLLASPRGV